MGDIGNWEFAAAVAAITIGLGGLLLFTVIAALWTWRSFSAVSRAAGDATREAQLSAMSASAEASSAPDERRRELEVEVLRVQVVALREGQARLQEALAGLAAIAGQNEDRDRHARDVDAAVRQLEETVGQIAVAVADLNQRIG